MLPERRESNAVTWPAFAGVTAATATALAFGAAAYLTPMMQQPTMRPTVTIAAAGGPTAVWSSDWNGQTNWHDNNLWTYLAGNTATLVVDSVDATSPTDYYLSVVTNVTSATGVPSAAGCPTTQPAPPLVGQAITWRHYMKFPNADSLAGGPDQQVHPQGYTNVTAGAGGLGNIPQIQINGPDSVNSYVSIVGTLHSALTFYVGPDNNGPGFFSNLDTAWYRYETTLNRISADRVTVDIAIYEHPEDTLVYNTATYDWSSNREPRTALANDTVVFADSATANDVITDWCGFSNGLFESPYNGYWDDPLEFMRWAAVAAVIGDSVGPYPITGES